MSFEDEVEYAEALCPTHAEAYLKSSVLKVEVYDKVRWWWYASTVLSLSLSLSVYLSVSFSLFLSLHEVLDTTSCVSCGLLGGVAPQLLNGISIA